MSAPATVEKHTCEGCGSTSQAALENRGIPDHPELEYWLRRDREACGRRILGKAKRPRRSRKPRATVASKPGGEGS